jgi:hypothetical protein
VKKCGIKTITSDLIMKMHAFFAAAVQGNPQYTSSAAGLQNYGASDLKVPHPIQSPSTRNSQKRSQARHLAISVT